MSERFIFQIVKGGGSHHTSDGREYTEGQNIESDEDLQEKFPGKFILTDKRQLTPTAPAMDFAKPAATNGNTAIATPPAAVVTPPAGNILTPPKGVGLSAKRVAGNKYNVSRDDTGEVIAKGISKRDAKDLCDGEPITIEG
jgi:hypothetical protein